MKPRNVVVSGLGLLLLTSCVHQDIPQPSPTDAVKTAEQAVAIATEVCRQTILKPGQRWTANLGNGGPVWGTVWHISASSDGNGACLEIRPSDGFVWRWDDTHFGYKPVPPSQARCGECVTVS